MANRGKAGSKSLRLKILAAYFQDLYGSDHYPTINQLACKFNVTTPTIYSDLELLRAKLGTQYIPRGLKLGRKVHVKIF